MKNVRKFVKHDIPDLEKLENTPAYKLLKHFNEGGTIKTADKELIRLVFNELWHPDCRQAHKEQANSLINHIIATSLYTINGN